MKRDEKVRELQMIEQSLQMLVMQKQQMQSGLMEIESALKEMQTSDKVYKIIGNIMVLADKAKLNEELEEKKKFSEVRIKSLEKQEEKIKEKASAIQKEVLEEINKEE